jgi:hypothetical protein
MTPVLGVWRTACPSPMGSLSLHLPAPLLASAVKPAPARVTRPRSSRPRPASITVPKKKKDGDLNWHDLRHEAGSRLAERGVDVRKVAGIAGPFEHNDDLALFQHQHPCSRAGDEESDGLVAPPRIVTQLSPDLPEPFQEIPGDRR